MLLFGMCTVVIFALIRSIEGKQVSSELIAFSLSSGRTIKAHESRILYFRSFAFNFYFFYNILKYNNLTSLNKKTLIFFSHHTPTQTNMRFIVYYVLH